MNKKRCEVCGKKACVTINDIAEWPDYENGWMDAEVCGTHYFCIEHQRDSVTIETPIDYSILYHEVTH